MCCGKQSNYGMCPRCLRLRELTKHHILPQRNWGNPKDTPLLHLCRSCHDIIDAMTEEWEMEARSFIISATAHWLLTSRSPT